VASWKPCHSMNFKRCSMRTIKQSGQFKRDLKREAKGPHRQVLQRDFVGIVAALANNQALAEKHCDHALSGE